MKYIVPVKIVAWYGAEITENEASLPKRQLRNLVEEKVIDDLEKWAEKKGISLSEVTAYVHGSFWRVR